MIVKFTHTIGIGPKVYVAGGVYDIDEKTQRALGGDFQVLDRGPVDTSMDAPPINAMMKQKKSRRK